MSTQTSSLVTIPGCTASHVLGSTSVDLAIGDLTLVSTPFIHSPTTEAAASSHAPRRPLLTLTVGRAAFPLYNDTVFGTVEGDERVYVFQPELGEDIKGYVKISLPEGVKLEGSEFWSLQERFEKVLVDNGLLQAKVGGEQPTS